MPSSLRVARGRRAAAAAAMLALTFCLFGPLTPPAAANLTFVTAWGALGSGPSQFNQPRGVAVDASGNV